MKILKPPAAIEKEELMEKIDEPENTFDPDELPVEEEKDESPPEKDEENPTIEQQSAVNIEDIGELEEFEPKVDT